MHLGSCEIKPFHIHIFTHILHHVWVYYELTQFISYSKISLSAGKKALTTLKFGESKISSPSHLLTPKKGLRQLIVRRTGFNTILVKVLQVSEMLVSERYRGSQR